MKEISELLKRSNFSNILFYLLYASGEDETLPESCDRAIEESYEAFFTAIEELYPGADRDNELFDILAKFSGTQNTVYFEAGVAAGFQLYKELDGAYERRVEQDLPRLLDRIAGR